jgi:hypothetical protein
VQEADDAPRGDADAEQPEEPGDLGGRQPALLAEHHGMGRSPGPEVTAGSTRGRGGLIGVPAPHRRPAAWAAAPLDREAAVEHRLGGQLLLVDVFGVLVDHLGAATWAQLRVRHDHGLVDVVGDLAVRLGAVGKSRAPAGTAGMRGGVVLREGSGLAAGLALEHLHHLLQPGHLVSQRLVVAT